MLTAPGPRPTQVNFELMLVSYDLGPQRAGITGAGRVLPGPDTDFVQALPG